MTAQLPEHLLYRLTHEGNVCFRQPYMVLIPVTPKLVEELERGRMAAELLGPAVNIDAPLPVGARFFDSARLPEVVEAEHAQIGSIVKMQVKEGGQARVLENVWIGATPSSMCCGPNVSTVEFGIDEDDDQRFLPNDPSLCVSRDGFSFETDEDKSQDNAFCSSRFQDVPGLLDAMQQARPTVIEKLLADMQRLYQAELGRDRDASGSIRAPESKGDPDEDIDTSEVPELDTTFFGSAILTRPGASLIANLHEQHPQLAQDAEGTRSNDVPRPRG